MSNKNNNNKAAREAANKAAEELESMRQEVLSRELRARFAKANYDTMYYSIEGEKLKEPYREFVERQYLEQAQRQEELSKIVPFQAYEGDVPANQEQVAETEAVEVTEQNPQ